MPTFPSPPLKFRMAGFPQYGFKASLSDPACPARREVKPAPGIPSRTARFAMILRAPPGDMIRSTPVASPEGQSEGIVTTGCAADPRGPWLRPELCCLRSSSLLRPHPPVSQAPHDFTVLRLIRAAFAVRERRGDPRDLPDFPCRPVPTCRRPYPGGSAGRSRCARPAIPGFLELQASRHPQPRLCQPSLPGVPFEAASFALGCGPCVCPALLTGYDGAPAPPAEVPCHSRFGHWPSPGSAGSQARWANGKSPIVGTRTRLVTTGSEAALEWGT